MKKSDWYIVLLLLVILTFLLTFINKIGLHGDEAFLGLDGIEILKNGISKPYGMNNYTGILQALFNSLSFKLWKINVTSLRISGILSNIISLFIIIKILKNKIGNKGTIIFLILFAQSIFLLCYSKIAWEVCSFNFLFIAIALFSIYKLENNNQNRSRIYLFLFLFSTLIGTYNHIIFSSSLVTMFFSIILYIWFNKIKPSDFILNCLSIAFTSLCNVVVLFFFMNHFVDDVWNKIGSLMFIFPIILIIIELFFFKKIYFLIEYAYKSLNKLTFSTKILKKIILVIPILIFFKIHFFKFYDVLGNNVLLMRLFSYQSSTILNLYFVVTATAIILLTSYFIISDFLNKNATIWTYFIIVYLGVFCLYTSGFSIRYYHILTLFLFLYLSINLFLSKAKIQLGFISIILINLLIVHFTLWNINLNYKRKVKAMNFKIGLKNTETSAHFLNFSPVIDFVKKNKIGKLNTVDIFFIGNVFNFYKHVYPEIETNRNVASVNYDYKIKGSGFKINLIDSDKTSSFYQKTKE